MSDFMGDLSTYFSAGNINSTNMAQTKKSSGSGMDLDMTDFLTLMVTELQNQSIDSTADTSDMLNQLVMMQMVSAMTNMTDASVMSYAASLVGKTVTVGQYDDNGILQEVVGKVTGTGTMDGEQVIFVKDKYYRMSEIMAVGTLPGSEVPEEELIEEIPEGFFPVIPPEEVPEETKPENTVPDVPTVPEVPENSETPAIPDEPFVPGVEDSENTENAENTENTESGAGASDQGGVNTVPETENQTPAVQDEVPDTTITPDTPDATDTPVAAEDDQSVNGTEVASGDMSQQQN